MTNSENTNLPTKRAPRTKVGQVYELDLGDGSLGYFLVALRVPGMQWLAWALPGKYTTRPTDDELQKLTLSSKVHPFFTVPSALVSVSGAQLVAQLTVEPKLSQIPPMRRMTYDLSKPDLPIVWYLWQGGNKEFLGPNLTPEQLLLPQLVGYGGDTLTIRMREQYWPTDRP